MSATWQKSLNGMPNLSAYQANRMCPVRRCFIVDISFLFSSIRSHELFPFHSSHIITRIETSHLQLTSLMNNSRMLSLQVKSDMCKLFHDDESGREVYFLVSSYVISLPSMLRCPGTLTRFKTNCLAITLICGCSLRFQILLLLYRGSQCTLAIRKKMDTII